MQCNILILSLFTSYSCTFADITAILSLSCSEPTIKKLPGKNKEPQIELTAEMRALFGEFLASRAQSANEK